jgi:hypothetical protein
MVVCSRLQLHEADTWWCSRLRQYCNTRERKARGDVESEEVYRAPTCKITLLFRWQPTFGQNCIPPHCKTSCGDDGASASRTTRSPRDAQQRRAARDEDDPGLAQAREVLRHAQDARNDARVWDVYATVCPWMMMMMMMMMQQQPRAAGAATHRRTVGPTLSSLGNNNNNNNRHGSNGHHRPRARDHRSSNQPTGIHPHSSPHKRTERAVSYHAAKRTKRTEGRSTHKMAA